MTNKLIAAAAIAAALLASTATSSFAGGFLAGLAQDLGFIDEQQRQTLDGVHAALGNPLDQLANQFGNPVGAPAQPAPQPQFRPQPQAQTSYGVYCVYNGQTFGPGPLAQVGTPCRTPFGIGYIY